MGGVSDCREASGAFLVVFWSVRRQLGFECFIVRETLSCYTGSHLEFAGGSSLGDMWEVCGGSGGIWCFPGSIFELLTSIVHLGFLGWLVSCAILVVIRRSIDGEFGPNRA